MKGVNVEGLYLKDDEEKMDGDPCNKIRLKVEEKIPCKSS